MSSTITTPVAGFTGRAFIGPAILDFTDGTATYDGDLSDGLRQYLQANGYGIDGPAAPAEPEQPTVDTRDLTGSAGVPLRDAAVDPSDDDFLAPTNAGQADPHGPLVVSPTIHAAETKTVVPGDVGPVKRQKQRETQLAQRTLSADELVPDVTADLADSAVNTTAADAANPDGGTAADAAATAQTPAPATVPDEGTPTVEDTTVTEPDPNMPAKNASADEWRAYAVSKGMSSEDADNASRDQLIAQYAG